MSENIVGDNGLPRCYLRACLLLLVAEAPVHGYEMLGCLRELGLCKADAGAIYRALRSLDQEGLVQSWWTPSVTGPPRRLYQTTVAGRQCLESLTAGLEQSHRHLSDYLGRHRSLTDSKATVARALFSFESNTGECRGCQPVQTRLEQETPCRAG